MEHLFRSLIATIVSVLVVIQIAILQPLPFAVTTPQVPSWYVDVTNKLPNNDVVYVGVNSLEGFLLMYWQSETRFHVRLANSFSGIFVPNTKTPQMPSLQDYMDASYLGQHYQQVLINTFKAQLLESGVDAVVFQDAPSNTYLIKIMQSITGYGGEVDSGGYLFVMKHSN
ncbi:MAG: hypothetical protein HKL80_03555 [Acidimicrobiales bacterium]|nr:hypothetical protein [Acidimicrobiales bacterium]